MRGRRDGVADAGQSADEGLPQNRSTCSRVDSGEPELSRTTSARLRFTSRDTCAASRAVNSASLQPRPRALSNRTSRGARRKLFCRKIRPNPLPSTTVHPTPRPACPPLPGRPPAGPTIRQSGDASVVRETAGQRQHLCANTCRPIGRPRNLPVGPRYVFLSERSRMACFTSAISRTSCPARSASSQPAPNSTNCRATKLFTASNPADQPDHPHGTHIPARWLGRKGIAFSLARAITSRFPTPHGKIQLRELLGGVRYFRIEAQRLVSQRCRLGSVSAQFVPVFTSTTKGTASGIHHAGHVLAHQLRQRHQLGRGSLEQVIRRGFADSNRADISSRDQPAIHASMASLMRSAAEPWITVLIAVRSGRFRCRGHLVERREWLVLRPRIVLTYPFARHPSSISVRNLSTPGIPSNTPR